VTAPDAERDLPPREERRAPPLSRLSTEPRLDELGPQRFSRIILPKFQKLVILIFMKDTINSQRIFAASNAAEPLGRLLTTLPRRSYWRKEAR
jgi:hypothetical protein